MSTWLSSMFGGGSAAPQRDGPKKAIIALRQHLDTLAKKEQYIEQRISEQEAIARKNITKNKSAAKAALMKKRRYEQELEKYQAQIATLEAQSSAIESANLNFETMKVMQAGASAMKNIHGNMDIDKVDATMDEIREQVALSDEIGQAISQPLGETFDEDELEDELEALQQEELDAKMLNAGTVPSSRLPVTPTKIDAESEDDEEDELRKLQREMAV
ncbi:Snf7-domain-containing protein [Lipomyces oligophaga]|uniref:Snf7-domain-containing protein n=1 Tax=Lipomyces oligophaga TaxID=45792 RepID=UPI0034D00210